jgi:hypothetical protein
MSKTGKIIGAVIVLPIGIFVVLIVFQWLFLDNRLARSKSQGAEFGKTTDYNGCQAEGISRIRNLSPQNSLEGLRAEYFVRGCLETSRPSPDFCDGVPIKPPHIQVYDDWKNEECKKLGWAEMSPNCRTVLRARLDFCEKQ